MEVDAVAGGGEPGFGLSIVERLSEASVRSHAEAYRDVDWDAPGHVIDPEDSRWEATASWDPLAASTWYRDQAPGTRAEIGLFRHACVLKIAIEFERVLSEGLLRYSRSLPNGDPVFRYVYHVVTEEAQHSLMFQEFINRSGLEPLGADEQVRVAFQRMVQTSEELPVLFFLAVLAGEEAFDFIQRCMLRSPTAHPLSARISRIHIAEEARHLAFGRAFLRDQVAKLDERAARALRYQVGFVLEWTAVRMFDLSRLVLAEWDCPEEVVHEVATGPVAQRLRRDCVARAVSLCDELGLADRRMARNWSLGGDAGSRVTGATR